MPEVIMAKKKYGKSKREKAADVRKNIWGVKNFLPEHPVGEGVRTISMHVQKIKVMNNMHPLNRKTSAVNTAMVNTLPVRRRKIVNEKYTIIDLIDEFHLLKGCNQVKI